jgi:hypothetical protein
MVELCDVIRHPRFMDVAILVDIAYTDGTIGGNWVNMGYVQTYIMGKRCDGMVIDDTWFKCTNPEVKCIRYANWTKI